MEPQGSLPFLKALANCHHPEPDKLSPHILKILFNDDLF
jgi:hypothetical protein